jgi:hypothetical protein
MRDLMLAIFSSQKDQLFSLTRCAAREAIVLLPTAYDLQRNLVRQAHATINCNVCG